MPSHSYILQIMLWHQSLKSIHYRTLLIFQYKKKRFEGQNMGGGDKRPMSKHGGDISPPSPPPPRIYALAYSEQSDDIESEY